ncbi:hypothetical protein G4V62_00220 [Bacillaceae bacterium SIJ1]|nr:hypothetical protein [Litoribacterium kuwaitense]NGP43466.1 hypothetical protein [Litoribacterium kuwaitense]
MVIHVNESVIRIHAPEKNDKETMHKAEEEIKEAVRLILIRRNQSSDSS